MALHAFLCAECGAPFEAVRSDAEMCSPVCRLRRHRARSDARQVAEIERAAALLASLRAASATMSEG